MNDFHVVVAGGGPAGLGAAIGFALRGLRVLVLERQEYPIDKACGEGVQPPGIAALRRLGVFEKIAPGDQSEIRGICYVTGGVTARAEFAEGAGAGIRRTALSQALRDRALETGVQILRRDLREVLPPYAEYVRDGRLPAIHAKTRLVVGADGLHSFVREWCGLAGPVRAPWNRFGARRHFRVPAEILPKFVEVHTGSLCEAYVTPAGPDILQIAFLWHEDKFPEKPHDVYNSLLSEFPALSLYGSEEAGRFRGAGRLWQNTKAAAVQGVVLAGDAAGYMDAITGEGISLALEEAEAVAGLSSVLTQASSPLSRDALHSFEAAYARITSNYRLTTRILLRLSRHPQLSLRAVRFLSRRPRLLQALLSVNMGSIRPMEALRELF